MDVMCSVCVSPAGAEPSSIDRDSARLDCISHPKSPTNASSMRGTMRLMAMKSASSSIMPAAWASRTRRRACTLGVADQSITPPAVRVGIVGAGLAGLATCYELLQGLDRQQQDQGSRRIEIQVMDRYGIAAGASGVAAGLLHPYNTRGGLLWKGLESVETALDLITLVERSSSKHLTTRCPFLRPARTEKQARGFDKQAKRIQERSRLELGAFSSEQVTPVVLRNPQAQEVVQISPDIVGSAFDAVLQISGAVAAVVDTPEYLKCLWKVCLQEAERKGISLTFKAGDLLSSAIDIKERHGFHCLLVAAGAGSNFLWKDLPLTPCFGTVIDVSAQGGGEEEDRVAVLGPCYLAPLPLEGTTPESRRRNVTIGATKQWRSARELVHDFAAVTMYTKPESSDGSGDVGLPQGLHTDAMDLIDKVSTMIRMDIEHDSIVRVKRGCRACPPRSEYGSLPIVGRLGSGVVACTGFGARGLVWHAISGRIAAYHVFEELQASAPPGLSPDQGWKSRVEFEMLRELQAQIHREPLGEQASG